MKKIGDHLQLSATDLASYLNCDHLSSLDRAVAEGILAQPKEWDPFLQILWERGSAHEQRYVEHLESVGLEVLRIEGVDVTERAVTETRSANRGSRRRPVFTLHFTLKG